jgi:hypothetical protein
VIADSTQSSAGTVRRDAFVLCLLEDLDPALQEVDPRCGQSGRLPEPEPGASGQRHRDPVTTGQSVLEGEHNLGGQRLNLPRVHLRQRHARAWVHRDHAALNNRKLLLVASVALGTTSSLRAAIRSLQEWDGLPAIRDQAIERPGCMDVRLP